MKLRVLDLFSGIGGFSLGLERTGGFETVAFCEIEEYPRRVLAKHWPGVPIYEDVRELTGARLAADGIAVDVICGGFPCQDVSFAGKRAGLEGARSGLWSEYARLVRELRPRYVLVENTPGLLSLGMGTVLGDLASLGYDAVWDCIPASAVGASHQRDRVWIVAHAEQGRQSSRTCGNSEPDDAYAPSSDVPDAASEHRWPGLRQAFTQRDRDEPANGNCDGAAWPAEPDVGRVAYGVPAWAHRIEALGNAVVPRIPEMIGRAILEAMS